MINSNLKLINFIADYAKQHAILDSLKSHPKLSERFAIDDSWLNYAKSYKIVDGVELEAETSVIYSDGSFVPRNVQFNLTLHVFDNSINFGHVTLRLESVDDLIREYVVEKLRNFNLLKDVLEKPNNLFEMLQVVVQKMKFSEKSPMISVSIRLFDCDVFFSEINSAEKIQSLVNLVETVRSYLLDQSKAASLIRNFFLIDSKLGQSLINGLQFNTLFDVSSSLMAVSGDGSEIKKFLR